MSLVGTASALVTVVLWGGWVVTTRLGVTAALTHYDVAFLRFLVPSVVLFPVLLRQGVPWRRVGLAPLVAMAAGAGAPFFLLSAAGMRVAPAADVGALLPGAMPLFVAGLSAGLFGERFGVSRLAGFGAIVAGVLAIAGHGLAGGEAGEWRGHLLFLAAAALWAGYTLAFRRAGIGAWHAAALVNAGSLVAFAPLYLLRLEPRLLVAPWREIALQGVYQGVLSGLVAMFTYGVAVRRLGASRAAAFSSLTPVIAALLAIPLLGERPDAVTWSGIAAVSGGVALASGALGGRPAAAARA